MWVNCLLEISQLGQLSLSSFRGRQMSSELQLDVRHLNQSVVAPSGERLRGKRQAWCLLQVKTE